MTYWKAPIWTTWSDLGRQVCCLKHFHLSYLGKRTTY